MSRKKEQWIKDVNRKGGETARQLMLADIPVPDAVVENFLNRGEMMILGSVKK